MWRCSDGEDEDDGEDAEVDVGTAVSFASRGKAYTGTITEWASDTAVLVKCNEDGKTRKVALDKCELSDDDDVVSDDAAEPDPEPDPKPTKRATKKATKAATPRKTAKKTTRKR